MPELALRFCTNLSRYPVNSLVFPTFMHEFILHLLEYRHGLQRVLAVGIDFPACGGLVSNMHFVGHWM